MLVRVRWIALLVFVGGVVLLGVAPLWAAQVMDVRHHVEGELSFVEVELDEAVDYTYHALPSQQGSLMRIYLDFPQTHRSSWINNVYSFGGDLVQRVRTAFRKPSDVRIVLDLTPYEDYEVYALQNPFRVVFAVSGESFDQRDAMAKVEAVEAVEEEITSVEPRINENILFCDDWSLAVQDGSLLITEEQFLNTLQTQMASVQHQVLETDIARQAVRGAKGIFEPEFSFDYKREFSFEQNDAEVSVQRGGSSTYREDESVYSSAIEGLLPLGTRYRVYYEMSDPTNSLQKHDAHGHEEQIEAGIEITQPLWRNYGSDVNKASIYKAGKGQQAAQQRLRRERMLGVYQGAVYYVNLQLAQERLQLEQQMLDLERDAAQIVLRFARQGKVSSSRVYQSESEIAQRQARVSFAMKLYRRCSSHMRQLLIGTTLQTLVEVRAVDPLERVLLAADDISWALDSEVNTQHRPEVVEAGLQCEIADITHKYASNQSKPQLDVIASYGKTGLGKDWDDSLRRMDDNYRFWSLGLDFSVPLFGGEQAQSALIAADIRKRQAALTLQTIQGRVQDEVVSAQNEVVHSQKEVQRLRSVTVKLFALLHEDHKRYEQGVLGKYEMLVRQVEVLQSRVYLVEKLAEFRRAQLELWLARGTILQEYDFAK